MDLCVYLAVQWLEQKMLALQGAGLPADTSLAQLEAMGLPAVNDPATAFYATAEADTLCIQRPLFCAVMLTENFVHSEPAWRIIRAIYALMWRDGIAFAVARDLHMALCNEWTHDSEIAARMGRAEDAQERRRATDAPALASQQDFLSDCADQRLGAYLPLQPGGAEQALDVAPGQNEL